MKGKLIIVSHLVFLFLALLLVSVPGFSQDVKFFGSAPGVVGVGEQFRVVYSLNDQGTGFRGPSFKGFTVLSGPGQSSSTNVQIINGSMTQSVSYTYTYILQADKEGTFSVDAASVSINGKSFKSNPISIQVVKGQGAHQQQSNRQQNGNQGGNQGGQTQQATGIGSSDLFVRAILNKSEAFQGEQILVTFKIYSKVSLVGFEDIKFPAFTGFWSSEIKMPGQISLQRETFNGSVYQVAELKKTILFAQKSGTLTIDPMNVTSIVQMRSQNKRKTGDPFFDNFFNDPFFNNSVQNVKKDVKSQPVTIKIKPLPENGQPQDFNGAVGSFSIKASIDKNVLKANEAVSLKVTVSGSGNLELIDKLNVNFPPDFEVYDPKITNNIAATANGVSGSRSFEYLIIPRNPGKYELKPILLPYFDLAKKAFQTVSTPEFNIEVQKGSGGSSISYGSVDKEDIKYLGSDIRYIKTNGASLAPLGYFFFNSLLFWILFLLPLLLFIIVLFVWQKQLKLRSDVSLMKHKKATAVAKKRLKSAYTYLQAKNEEPFYEEISQAIWGYLSDKFSIPRASLSMDLVCEVLEKRNISTNVIDDFREILNSCEFARFAPGTKDEKMDKLYEQTLNVISKSEKELR